MKAKIEQWLINWFLQKEPDVSLGASDDYFEQGVIDSFGVIELIEDIEDEFQIQFSEDSFQDRRFPTIGGLSEIVSEIKNG